MEAKKILIADDDQQSRELLVKMALKYGYNVAGAKDGVELLNLCEGTRFDVIITDLMMANLSGVSAVETLKKQGSTVPVIALTGQTPCEMKSMEDNFIKIFHKPCIVKELFDYVGWIIENHGGRLQK